MADKLKEKIACLIHEQWCHWMSYLFSVSIQNDDGSITIPTVKVQRWKRQTETNYSDLPDNEKESDLELADRYIELLEHIRK